jgi:HK97 family phage major capsid protein
VSVTIRSASARRPTRVRKAVSISRLVVAVRISNYIWRNSMTAGAPPVLLGYPVECSEDMPDVGANTFPIAFGNFKRGYVVIDKLGIRFLRDPFTDKPNVLAYAYRRVGGSTANTEAIKLLKIATT